MTYQLISPIEVYSVCCLELMHPFGEVRLSSRHDEVKMILHQNKTVRLDSVALNSFGQITQELQSIPVISEDLFSSVAACHHMV